MFTRSKEATQEHIRELLNKSQTTGSTSNQTSSAETSVPRELPQAKDPADTAAGSSNLPCIEPGELAASQQIAVPVPDPEKESGNTPAVIKSARLLNQQIKSIVIPGKSAVEKVKLLVNEGDIAELQLLRENIRRKVSELAEYYKKLDRYLPED